MDFKISLKAARVNADLTLREAAALIGVNKSTLMNWERKPWLVNPLRQDAISKAYDISIDYINFAPKN